jgi:hypothetical protein
MALADEITDFDQVAEARPRQSQIISTTMPAQIPDPAAIKVEVRPLDRKSWHGKKGKESFAQPKAVEALYEHTTGKYATGLTEDEAIKYGKLIGADLSDTFNPSEPHPYYSTKPGTVMLQNHTMIFDISKPAEYVKVKLMKANKLVANSMKEYEEGKWPDATHVIFDEEEEVSSKANKVQLRRKASAMLLEMSDDSKANIIQILSKKSVKGRSGNFIDVEIDAIIQNNEPNQPGILEFTELVSMGREEVAVRASVLNLLQRDILTKEAGSIYYMGELIGIDYEAAVEWFKSPSNAKLKVAILERGNK